MANTNRNAKSQANEKKNTAKKISPTIVVIKANETQATLTIGTCHCSS